MAKDGLAVSLDGQGKPMWLVLELTYRCPLKCVWCNNPLDFDKYGKQELSTEEWKRVLREGRELGALQLGFSGGEPMLRDDLEELVEEFGLQKVRKNNGDSLSGGERRRTEIARALATSPNFILLDEPFAGIDPIAVEDIQSIVAKLKTKNIGILITDHNVQETLSITDRAYLMFEGNILKAGTAEELAADEMVRKVYLGKNFELRKRHVDIHS